MHPGKRENKRTKSPFPWAKKQLEQMLGTDAWNRCCSNCPKGWSLGSENTGENLIRTHLIQKIYAKNYFMSTPKKTHDVIFADFSCNPRK
jgi:hypothetical protein